MGLPEYIEGSKRIIRISKKPTMKELMEVMKVTGLGIIIIGLMGTIIRLALNLIGIGII